MNRALYLEGSCGISGDMTVAALLDLGGESARSALDAALGSMDLDGLEYSVSTGRSYGISGCCFHVILPHHHDHHEHGHDHHEHRNLEDVCKLLESGKMTSSARELAKQIFRIVAEAEAKAHGCRIEEVHFHEVGALDSIADIAGIAVLFDHLGISECIVTGLSEGSGSVHCRHGELPVPVPAVLNIAQKYEIPLRHTGIDGEMVTPTGIAAAAALRTRNEMPETFIVEKTGIGLGTRDFGRANILRAMILRFE